MAEAYRIPETVETARYRLRRVAPGDAPAIFERYAQDRQVTRYLGWRPHVSLAETMDFVTSAARDWETGRGFPFVVLPRGGPAGPIGMVHPRVAGATVTYGYVLARMAWGQGCATEILSRLVGHAMAHPAIFRAEAFCDVENRASARVMEKAGMAQEGVLRRYFRHPNLSPAPRDCAMYARVR